MRSLTPAQSHESISNYCPCTPCNHWRCCCVCWMSSFLIFYQPVVLCFVCMHNAVIVDNATGANYRTVVIQVSSLLFQKDSPFIFQQANGSFNDNPSSRQRSKRCLLVVLWDMAIVGKRFIISMVATKQRLLLSTVELDFNVCPLELFHVQEREFCCLTFSIQPSVCTHCRIMNPTIQ